MIKPLILASSVLTLTASLAAAATMVEVRFQGLGPIGFAPVLGAFSNGAYDIFNAGTAASSQLETLAEVGNPGPLLGIVPAGVNAGTVTSGPGGAGVMGTSVFNVADGNGFFSYASMLLPTNDWFISNGNPLAHDVSSLLNAAPGTMLTFDVSTVWDAGTELEDFDFSAGNPLFAGLQPGNDALGTTQGGVITAVDRSTNPFIPFASQPGGFNPNSLDISGSAPVARFTLTVVPEPGTALLCAVGSLGLGLRRKRKAGATPQA